MGNWTIVINGTGCHHNKDNPNDANRMASRFCRDLVRSGHILEATTFTHGAREDSLLKDVDEPKG